MEALWKLYALSVSNLSYTKITKVNLSRYVYIYMSLRPDEWSENFMKQPVDTSR